MTMAPEQLEALLLQLTANDSQMIQQAESQLKEYLKSGDSIVGLMTQLQGSSNPSVRQLAAVMLKKKILKFWPSIDGNVKTNIKATLLQRASQDDTSLVRSSIADVIASLATHEIETGTWPELMPYVDTCCKSNEPVQREVGMNLLRLLCESTGTHLQPHLQSLLPLFAIGLQDTANMNIRVNAMRAACVIIEYLEETDFQTFTQLVPLMLQVLQQCIVDGCEPEAVEFLDIFSDIANHPYPFLDNNFKPFIELLLQMICHDGLDSKTHAAASQSLGEYIKRKPKSIGKQNLVSKIFVTMLDIIAADDTVTCGLISGLLSKDEGEEQDDMDESRGHLAQQTIDTLALNVPGKYLNSIVFGTCNEYIQSEDPRKRKTGVLALGIVSEGCCDFMSDHLQDLLQAVYRVAGDQNLMVREASCFALGQFAEFLQPAITAHYPDILPIGLTLIDGETSKIKATALYVLDEITQSMEIEQVLPYLDTLVKKLVVELQTAPPQVKKMTLDTLGSIAMAAKEAFLPYFQEVANLIQPLWSIADPKYYYLRGSAIECLGYFATALGKEAFRPYLEPSMPFVMACFELNEAELEEQAFVFFINVVGIFKDEFAPYLETAATVALRVIQSDEGIEIKSKDDQFANLVSDEDDDDDEYVMPHHVSIRTDALSTKVRAITAVEEMALHCGPAFEPYIPKFLESLAPLCQYIHEDVRAAVAEALAALTVCSFESSHPNSSESQVWVKGDLTTDILSHNNKLIVKAVMHALVEELTEDPEAVVVEKAFSAIKIISARVGPLATVQYLEKITERINTILLNEHVCQAMYEQDDDDEADDGTAQNDTLLEDAAELVGVLGKCYGEKFDECFKRLFEPFLSYTTGIRSARDRSSAIGCFAEVLREMGPHSLQYVERAFQPTLQALTSDSELLKANSAFCMGILVEVSGANLLGAYESILQGLYPLFDPSKNDAAVVDNACAAVARMICTGGNAVPLEKVLPVYLSAMPLKIDMDENPAVFNCLNGLVHSQNPAALNLLPQVLSVYAGALDNGSKVEDEIQQQIVGCIRGLKTSYAAQMQEAINHLSPEHQTIIAAACN